MYDINRPYQSQRVNLGQSLSNLGSTLLDLKKQKQLDEQNELAMQLKQLQIDEHNRKLQAKAKEDEIKAAINRDYQTWLVDNPDATSTDMFKKQFELKQQYRPMQSKEELKEMMAFEGAETDKKRMDMEGLLLMSARNNDQGMYQYAVGNLIDMGVKGAEMAPTSVGEANTFVKNFALNQMEPKDREKHILELEKQRETEYQNRHSRELAEKKQKWEMSGGKQKLEMRLEQEKLRNQLPVGLRAKAPSMDTKAGGNYLTAAGVEDVREKYEEVTDITGKFDEVIDLYNKSGKEIMPGAAKAQMTSLINTIIFRLGKLNGTGAIQQHEENLLKGIAENPSTFPLLYKDYEKIYNRLGERYLEELNTKASTYGFDELKKKDLPLKYSGTRKTATKLKNLPEFTDNLEDF